MTKTFNFSANGIDFGNYQGATQEEAQEAFASEAGYTSWAAMVEQAEGLAIKAVEVSETAEA